MKAALGGGYLLNIAIFIISIVMLLFVGVLAYSRAYRIKDRIIEVIENNNGYNDNAKAMINEDLHKSGYITVRNLNCPMMDGKVNINDNSNYKYCIYGPYSTSNGEYYKVVTYMQFDIPLIGDMLNIPIKGETKILSKKYRY